ncbi:MAG: bifunctional [glutamate--ammonia ligase]-adenylyl-L-tyrosine phosphorylase/[glutamate--ammonia-ligase] adenylyltransferase [Gammaproteobacteria bacterium]
MPAMTQPEIPPLLLSQVPLALREKVSIHWEAWQQACRNIEQSESVGLDLALLGKHWACSDFVAGVMIKQPAQCLAMFNTGELDSSKNLEQYQSELAGLLADLPLANDFALMQGLRQFRQRQMFRIAWRDLATQAATLETLANLTDLAETCVELTLEYLYQDQCQALGTPTDAEGQSMRMVVLGMGKLGGHELNFSSDIDLIFAYPEEGEVKNGRAMANSQFFIRLGQRFIKVLNDVTGDGFVFRVDMRLRPYGDSGPLVMSFDGMEQYYQTQGRDWERYAMIKARVIGGDREAGKELMDMLKPFVYRRYLDFGAFQSIREMKVMIDKEIRRKGNLNNIKLGEGGIREIEFIGQTFQLIRGGGEPDMQIRSIVKVLNLLSDKGYLPEQETEQLTENYDFLRRLENRLQMYADGQTHLLPADELPQTAMALAMDYPDWPSLLGDIERHRQQVHHSFNQTFAKSTGDSSSDSSAGRGITEIWLSGLEKAETMAWLNDNGCAEAESVFHQLQMFRDSSQLKSLTGTARQRLDDLMPLMLKQLIEQARPEVVLQRLLNLLQAIVRRSVYLSLLIEYPLALKQLVKLCAASPWIAHLLTRYPILLDELLDFRVLYELHDKAQLMEQLDSLVDAVQGDEEREMEVLRKFKQAQVLRIAAMDVANSLEVFEVSEQLTLIAEVLVAKVYQLAWQHMIKRHGRPMCELEGQSCEPEMAIIAYGKMGGRELGYASDLDIVFLHNSHGDRQYSNGERSIDNSTFFARLAQRVVHILSAQTATGRLYEIDTRLRPDGAAGMLVSSLEAFEYYQKEKAWTWEHQALIRARMVLGPPHIGEEFDRIRHAVLARPRELQPLKSDVCEMRQKMSENLGSKKAGEFHIKHDSGGIVDIEFIAQYGVLATAASHPELLQQTATRKILKGLLISGILQPEDVERLSQAYQDYRVYSHQLALQEQSSIVNDSLFESQRADVTTIWQNVLVNESSTNS